jgi:Zn-finger nucleic acid-binding protein
MNRRNYGGSSGVIVDLCAEDGLWFDDDELERVLEWIRSGGLKRAERRTEEERRRSERERRRRRAELAEVADAGGDDYGLGGDLAALGGLLAGLFRLGGDPGRNGSSG